ncbi:bifunctional 4-hydroxy-2-oxoglutarate aldolase/2-dehydro-3-deoxy-phosphogluconate aldolase [Leucobacter sp. M11]|uniref:bifunctional 4-hydroxy-2-oxoglutarate aldolase/2-dehydro-3-deoxy-phosphogluconate aldolase n=1 Tax=Leucobacter sp. M11 TaxID=2993565 RepID=UPI002D7EBDAF|nr:bifunctional 4-hydroxy-2-oxoglutarate aldolase/2-dehydro-3-deoxy-phosphogluconate aldolase [Leucobacter sp. M11]MEB4614565.1 bifunctional 4-hydroxy-2-oxoglutarate aldolase/2-dehydro-3-deoxy-phosphogluconate aldolase [Leucobacter sp. M11]
MDGDSYFETHLTQHPVMGIFRSYGPEKTVALCERAWASGVRLVEIPVPNEAAVPSFLAAQEAGKAHGAEVGAGTITTVSRLERVHELGARFTVAPGMNPAVAEASVRLGVPHLPGVATSSEIGLAVAHGMHWVKAFPAAQLGSAWITAQRAPFAEVNFVATGGIDADNAAEFLGAGCRALAIGSAFGEDVSIDAIAAAVRGVSER